MNKILIALIATCLSATSFAEENSEISTVIPYEPATSLGITVGANLLHVREVALVPKAIGTTIIVSTHVDEHETVFSD